MEIRGSIAIVTITRSLDRAAAERLFEEVSRRVDGARVKALIYDATDLPAFDREVIELARPNAKMLAQRGVRIAVVSGSALVRFALASIKLVTSGSIESFETLDGALAHMRAG